MRRVLAVAVVLVLGGCSTQPGTRWSAPAPTAVASAASPWTPREFTVLGAGDVLLHEGLWNTARQAAGGTGYDFGPMFAAVKPTVSAADLAICHMETPLGEPDGPFSGYPSFNVPPQVAVTLKDIGYDSCSTASNHTLDVGERGVRRTLDVLDAAGLRHAGSYRSQAEHDTPTLLYARGVQVAHLSYTFSFNGQLRPEGKDWIANALDVRDILDEAHRARAAGAEVVVVSIHWGTEYQHEADDSQQRIARDLLASPYVDLILGAHVHVVQPFERIGDKWVAYGMGNQVAWQNQALDTRDGVMPRFTFTESAPGVWKVSKAEALPTWMLLDSGPARLEYCPGATTPTCADSTRRTMGTVRSMGATVQ
ncbi:CapA family protein [Longispora sp. K20-0274]|uniref:CapA family protein n=1 Tax=Longispora sp. K20-0274 TaxID=3088255 RepID=UPI003999B17C